MPPVAASEGGGAQTHRAAEPAGGAWWGLDGQGGGTGGCLVPGHPVSRTPLERGAGGGESPVGDGGMGGVVLVREYRPTREIGWEAGATTPQG